MTGPAWDRLPERFRKAEKVPIRIRTTAEARWALEQANRIAPNASTVDILEELRKTFPGMTLERAQELYRQGVQFVQQQPGSYRTSDRAQVCGAWAVGEDGAYLATAVIEEVPLYLRCMGPKGHQDDHEVWLTSGLQGSFAAPIVSWELPPESVELPQGDSPIVDGSHRGGANA